jgi:hypothetical protein
MQQPIDRNGVRVGDVVAVRRHAERRRRAGQLKAFFDRHRHAVEWSGRLVARDAVVRSARPAPRALVIAHDDGVDDTVVTLDARDEILEQFEAAEFARANELRERAGRCERRLDHRSAAALISSAAGNDLGIAPYFAHASITG